MAPGEIRIELINWGGSDGTEALMTVQAVLNMTSGTLEAHDTSTDFYLPGAGYGRAPTQGIRPAQRITVACQMEAERGA